MSFLHPKSCFEEYEILNLALSLLMDVTSAKALLTFPLILLPICNLYFPFTLIKSFLTKETLKSTDKNPVPLLTYNCSFSSKNALFCTTVMSG